MSTKIQFKRGTAAQVAGETPDVGEPIYETDTNKLLVGDNVTAGGVGIDHGGLSGLADDDHTQYALKSLFDAQTILSAVSDDTPVALAVAEQTLIGRITAGNIAALTTTQVRTLINVADGANAYVHPNHSGEVTSVADGAQTIANDVVTYAKMQNVSATDKVLGRVTAGAGDVEEIACTAFARSILDDANEATFKATVNLEAGVDVQAYDATLLSIAALGTAANKMLYTTGIDIWVEASLTAAGRALLDDANAAAQLVTLGLTATAAELNILDGCTALYTELNLLDLAGLTAGEVLVATAATTAAWQSTGVKLSAPDISGTVTAASALTLPAFSLAGTVTLGGQVFDAGAGSAQINTTGYYEGLIIQSTQSTAGGAMLTLSTIDASPDASDKIGAIAYLGRNSIGGTIEYGRIRTEIFDPISTQETGGIFITLMNLGSENLVMTLSAAGALWTDASVDTLTYKVSGTQVVSAQGAAVADATDAATTMARLNDLLGRLRTHGLIAT